jgi:hypothetical protein
MLCKGGCHCGAITMVIEGELDGAVACACSMCSKKGGLSWAVPRKALRVRANEDDIGTYSFGDGLYLHRFCLVCGVHPYHEDADLSEDPCAYINVRCLVGIDVAKVRT